jgi:hypothetical protein
MVTHALKKRKDLLPNYHIRQNQIPALERNLNQKCDFFTVVKEKLLILFLLELLINSVVGKKCYFQAFSFVFCADYFRAKRINKYVN